jgi:3-oxoacyl-ACP reductase-like protein
MKEILFSVVATFAVISFSTISYASDPAKPVVPAGPVYATFPGGVIQNDAEKAAEARKNAETKDAQERVETEAKDAKAKADSMAAKAKAKADAAAAAKDTSSAPR